MQELCLQAVSAVSGMKSERALSNYSRYFPMARVISSRTIGYKWSRRFFRWTAPISLRTVRLLPSLSRAHVDHNHESCWNHDALRPRGKWERHRSNYRKHINQELTWLPKRPSAACTEKSIGRPISWPMTFRSRW